MSEAANCFQFLMSEMYHFFFLFKIQKGKKKKRKENTFVSRGLVNHFSLIDSLFSVHCKILILRLKEINIGE